jgi:hypothetical protein
LQGMDDPAARYAIAVPRTPRFLRQLARVPDRVRQALNLHWLIVDESGAVMTIGPEEPSDRLGA